MYKFDMNGFIFANSFVTCLSTVTGHVWLVSTRLLFHLCFILPPPFAPAFFQINSLWPSTSYANSLFATISLNCLITFLDKFYKERDSHSQWKPMERKICATLANSFNKVNTINLDITDFDTKYVEVRYSQWYHHGEPSTSHTEVSSTAWQGCF